MAVQQRRNSKTRKAKRRTHYKLSAPAMVKCPSCGEYKLAHRACPNKPPNGWFLFYLRKMHKCAFFYLHLWEIRYNSGVKWIEVGESGKCLLGNTNTI